MFLSPTCAESKTNKNLAFSSPVKKVPIPVFNYTTFGAAHKESAGDEEWQLTQLELNWGKREEKVRKHVLNLADKGEARRQIGFVYLRRLMR